jgi:hypothetical protein
VDDAEAMAVIAYLDRQMLAARMILPPRVGPEPVPCPVCGMGRLACAMVFGRHRADEIEAREYLARHPIGWPAGTV